MKELTYDEVDDGAAMYYNTQVEYWVTPNPQTLQDFVEKYHDVAGSYQHIPFLDEDGNVQLAHVALDKDGNRLGACNDSHPCPPCCPKCPDQ